MTKHQLVAVALLCLLLVGCSLFHKKAPPGPTIDDPPKSNGKTAIVATMPWVILACLAGIGGSVFLVIQGNKLGFASGASCVAMGVIAIAISAHIVLIGWIGLALLIAVCATMIWQAIINRKAIVEGIWTNEASKDEMNVHQKEVVFGDSGIADQIQSPSTKKIVAAVRKAL